MSTDEFIKNRLEKPSLPSLPEQFIELAETENSLENSLIVLEVPLEDYTLTDIARIVESNSAQIIALSVLPVAEGTNLLISLKLNVTDPSSVLRSFERFNYKVVYYFMREGKITDIQRERLDELIYYLDM